jgi:flagellar hook-length control protein FliK
MTMNNVSISASSIVSSATTPSDGPVSSPVQNGGVFFRSLASAPSSTGNNASQQTQQTHSAAPAGDGANSKGPTNSTVNTPTPRKSSGSGNLKKAVNSTTTSDDQGSDASSTDNTTSNQSAAEVNSPTTAQTAAIPTPVTGSSPATDASGNPSPPPAGVVELLANSSTSTKKNPAQSLHSGGQTSSNDADTTVPASLADVLSQGSATSTTKSQTPQNASTGSGSNAGSTVNTGPSNTTDALNLAAASAAPTSTALVESSPNSTAAQNGNISNRLSVGTAASSNLDPTEAANLSAASANQFGDEALAAEVTSVAQGDATPTNSTGQQPTPIGPNKATGASDSNPTTKTTAAADPATAGATSNLPQNTTGNSATNTTTHVTGNPVSDSLQRTQELVDRVTNSLRVGFDNGGQLRMRLEPPAIGKVQVEVAAGDSGVTARLEVQTPAARQALLDNISLLHTAISQTGASVNRIEVVVAPQTKEDAPRDQQSNSGGQQQASQQDSSSGGSQNQKNGQQRNQTAGKSSTGLDQLDIEI